MAVRGRKPRQKNTKLPEFQGLPVMPEWLSAYGKECWAFIVPILQEQNMLTKIDSGALASYCESYSNFRLATETLAAEGQIIQSKIGSRPHPACKIQETALRSMLVYAAEFGLTPNSRQKVQVKIPEEINPFASFLPQLKAK